MCSRTFKFALTISVLTALEPVSSRGEGEPVRLATAARFDLSADVEAGSLEDGKVVAGNGTLARMTWVPESEQARGYTVSFAVTDLGWRRWRSSSRRPAPEPSR